MNTFSRFDVLKSEVDLNAATRIKKNVKKDKIKSESEVKHKNNEKSQVKNQLNNNNNNNNNNIKPINKKKRGDSELQALAFGFGKSKGKKKSGNSGSQKEKLDNGGPQKKAAKKGKENQNDVDSSNDEWQKRDEEFIKSVNEESLREAILQSKLAFEEKKREDERKNKTEEKKDPPILPSSKKGKNKKKKDKPMTLSLEQFNNLKTNEYPKNVNHYGDAKEKENLPLKLSEDRFFNDIEETTKKTLEMETRQDQYKVHKSNMNNKSNAEKQQIRQLNSEIEKRDFEIQALRLEVDSLRNQLQSVKSRNKKLCEVISFSEMRAKGELVIELEKVTKNRDVFSEEIARLTAELEQERTKVSHLTVELKKIQGKKRNADSSSK